MNRTATSNLARFAAALRASGIDANLRDEIDAAHALTTVDIADQAEVRSALLIALKIRPRDRALFDQLFDTWWVRPDAQSPFKRRSDATPVMPSSTNRLKPVPMPEKEPPATDADGTSTGYSPQALLRRKPFDQYTDHDRRDMEQLLAHLALRLATRRSRRLVPTHGRGKVDLRRSLRRSLGTLGEPVDLAARTRAVEQPRLVVLCDTSGSMDTHTRFLLTFVLSIKRIANRTEVFAFNTALTRLTRSLTPHKVMATLDRLSAEVPDWSGGTKIGESLAEFVAMYQNQLVDGRTVVVVLSDGLDRGDPSILIRAMRAIHRRARKVIWLNPLLGDGRYEPTARGMHAALPFIDHFVAAHNLESLERVVPLLTA